MAEELSSFARRTTSMSFLNYLQILDDGRRCQSCCNRAQLFGCRDLRSGWIGDCCECNMRWYHGQIACVRRGTHDMVHTDRVAARNLWKIGLLGTSLVYRYAGLDIKFNRSGASFTRQRKMLKSNLTNEIESDEKSARFHQVL